MVKKLSDIKPDKENPRILTEEARGALGFSMEGFGDISGITLNERTGELATGHQRWGELVKRGENPDVKQVKRYKFRGEWEKLCTVFTEKAGLFTIRVVDWTKEKQQAANLAANSRLLAGDYTQEAIGLLKEAEAAFPDMYEPLRFDALLEELESAFEDLDEPGDGLTDPDDVPDVLDDPITKPGDLWILGDHRLLCGDATKKEDVARLMDGKKADMVFTDPPYGVDIVAENGKIGADNLAKNKIYAPIKNDNTTETAKRAMGIVLDSSAIIWGGNYFTDFLPPSPGWIVWDKREETTSDNFADCELAWTSFDRPARIYKHLWRGMIRKGDDGEKVHPTQKPVKLHIDILRDYTEINCLILDPFLGSGTTLIAAEQLGRKCYGMEIEPKYCDVIIKRWEDFTGKSARKL